MKPDYDEDITVLQAVTNSDISAHSIAHAMDIIWDEIAPKGYHVGTDYYSLSIGIEGDLLPAMDFARAWRFNFSLDKRFDQDEWEISVYSTDPEVKRVVFWSDGA